MLPSDVRWHRACRTRSERARSEGMADTGVSGYIRASARARSPSDMTHAVDSRGGGTVRARFGMRSAGLLFGVLALALGGCGTLPASRGSHIHPAFLESPPSSFA